jgi:hypothetical protein
MKSGHSTVTGTKATLFPTDGQPAICPWRLALICVMQFIEGLSDGQAFPLRLAAVSTGNMLYR